MTRKLYTLLTALVCTLFAHAQGSVGLASFDANSNGTIETAEFQAALNSTYTNIFCDPIVYTISATLVVPSNKTLWGEGATLVPSSGFPTGKYMINTSAATLLTKTGLSVAVDSNQYTFTLPDASAIVVGRITVLYGGPHSTYSDAYNYGWMSRVASKAGNVVTMETPAPRNFTATSLKQFKTSDNVHIKELHVDSRTRSGGYGIGLQYAYRSTIENCTVESLPTATGLAQGIVMQHCLASKITNSHVKNVAMAGIAGTGYAFAMTGVNDTLQYSRVDGARTGVSSAGRDYISTGIAYLYDTMNIGGVGTSLDLHGSASGNIIGNVVYITNQQADPRVAIQARYFNTVISNNKVYFNASPYRNWGVFCYENGYKNVTITNNTFYYESLPVLPVAVTMAGNLGGPISNITNSGNTVVSGVPGEDPPVIDVDPDIPPFEEGECQLVHFFKQQ